MVPRFFPCTFRRRNNFCTASALRALLIPLLAAGLNLAALGQSRDQSSATQTSQTQSSQGQSSPPATNSQKNPNQQEAPPTPPPPREAKEDRGHARLLHPRGCAVGDGSGLGDDQRRPVHFKSEER